jgi:asparagine synthase (glutamine-hydrolysing)
MNLGRADLEVMNRVLAHRGPDGAGIHLDGSAGLAHTRLAIIDPVGGVQPMTTPDGRHTLCFNGEIYNFRELRRELEADGFRPRTDSDTEVLLHLLATSWTEGLARLNGMFALACWDARWKRLLLARDRLGMKPLYVCEHGGGLLFASEIKAMLPHLPGREPDLETIYEFFTFQNVLGDRTFFRHVRKLPQGGYLEWTPEGVTRGRFWTFSFPEPFSGDFGAAVEQYGQLLDAAVARHMIADVPLGSYLSGGIDSASVATLAAGRCDGPLHTFTGAFTDAPYYDEREGSRAVAGAIGAVRHEVEISPGDYLKNIGRVIYHLDEPTLGTGALPQFMVSELTARSVKVVLTGHGGDETFAGYQVFKTALIRETPGILGKLAALSRVRPDELTRVLYFLLYPLRYPEVGSGLFIMTPRARRAAFFTPDFLAAMRGFEPTQRIAQALGGDEATPGQRMLRLYLTTYLPTLFIQEDKVGMAHSLEARMPLCDNTLLDLALSLPLGLKLHGGALKAIPRAAMRRRLPDTLFSLPKRGFPTPFARWYRREPLRSFIRDLLFSPAARQRGIVNPGHLQGLLDALDKGSGDGLMDYARANTLYSASAVELWFRTFMDAPQPARAA